MKSTDFAEGELSNAKRVDFGLRVYFDENKEYEFQKASLNKDYERAEKFFCSKFYPKYNSSYFDHIDHFRKQDPQHVVCFALAVDDEKLLDLAYRKNQYFFEQTNVDGIISRTFPETPFDYLLIKNDIRLLNKLYDSETLSAILRKESPDAIKNKLVSYFGRSLKAFIKKNKVIPSCIIQFSEDKNINLNNLIDNPEKGVAFINSSYKTQKELIQKDENFGSFITAATGFHYNKVGIFFEKHLQENPSHIRINGQPIIGYIINNGGIYPSSLQMLMNIDILKNDFISNFHQVKTTSKNWMDKSILNILRENNLNFKKPDFLIAWIKAYGSSTNYKEFSNKIKSLKEFDSNILMDYMDANGEIQSPLEHIKDLTQINKRKMGYSLEKNILKSNTKRKKNTTKTL